MFKMFRSFLFCLPLALLLLSGCAGPHQMTVRSEPSNAEVVFDGKTYSNTPTRVQVNKDGMDHYLFVNKQGYQEARKVFRKNVYPKDVLVRLEPAPTPAPDDAAGGSGFGEQSLAGQGSGSGDFTQLSDQPVAGADDQQSAINARLADENTIYFAYDSDHITPQAKDILTAKAQWLRDHPLANVLIEGHTDERGTGAYNLALGDRRAERAKSFLINLGIESHRLRTISYGEERPVDPGHDESAWSKNRRAFFLID